MIAGKRESGGGGGRRERRALDASQQPVLHCWQCFDKDGAVIPVARLAIWTKDDGGFYGGAGVPNYGVERWAALITPDERMHTSAVELVCKRNPRRHRQTYKPQTLIPDVPWVFRPRPRAAPGPLAAGLQGPSPGEPPDPSGP